MEADIFPAGSRVAAYFRDSGGIAQGLSIPQQQEKVGEWCKTNGLILTRTFADVARSGTSTIGRDAFLEMMAYFDGTVKEVGLVIWEYSRFSRSYTDAQYYLADLRRKGYIVHSMTDNVPQGLDGQMLEGMKLWMNARYSVELGKNVMRGQRYNLNIHHGWRWRVPPGYQLDEINIGDFRNGDARLIHRLVPDPLTAPLVKKAYEMRLAGATMREIHEVCHFRQHYESYIKLLSNPIYLGIFDHQGVRIEGYCEPLIDADTFNRVQALIASRARRQGYEHPRVLRSRFFLSGLLVCSKCGMGMYGQSSSAQGGRYHYDYYRCNGSRTFGTDCGSLRVRKEWIEGRVVEVLRSIILDKTVQDNITKEVQAQIAGANKERAHLQEQVKVQIRENETQLNRVVSAIKEVGHSRMLLVELNLLEAQQVSLQLELEKAQAAVVPLAVPLPLDDISGEVDAALSRADFQQLGVIVRGFITRITLARKWKHVITGRVEYSIAGSMPHYVDI